MVITFVFFMINVNRRVRKKLSKGNMSRFQVKMIYLSLLSLFVLMFAIEGPFIPGWHFRNIWLGLS